MTRIRLAAIAFSLLVGAAAQADLRTYDVDIRYRQEIYNALVTVLDSDATPSPNAVTKYGRVQLLPTGQILVDAAPETLAQVEAVLRAIEQRAATPAPQVTLRYWAVLGAPPGTAADMTPEQQVPAVLRDVVAELVRTHGDRNLAEFRVLGSAALMTESGQHGELDSSTLSVRQTAYVQGETVNADIWMILHGTPPRLGTREQFVVTVPPSGTNGRIEAGALQVRATLRRGDFVVLGQSALQGGALDGPVFYIVHWPDNE